MKLQYKVEALAPTGLTTAKALENQVQARLDSHAKAGWRLHAITNVTGTGSMMGTPIGPYLVMVFEAGETGPK